MDNYLSAQNKAYVYNFVKGDIYSKTNYNIDDDNKYLVLFEAVGLLGGQCWYSGSDEQQFNDLMGKAQFVSVQPASRSNQTPEFEVK